VQQNFQENLNMLRWLSRQLRRTRRRNRIHSGYLILNLIFVAYFNLHLQLHRRLQLGQVGRANLERIPQRFELILYSHERSKRDAAQSDWGEVHPTIATSRRIAVPKRKVDISISTNS